MTGPAAGGHALPQRLLVSGAGIAGPVTRAIHDAATAVSLKPYGWLSTRPSETRS